MSLLIGDKTFKYKKDALEHYKKILNSYDFGMSLNDQDYKDIIDLVEFDYINFLSNSSDIDDIEGEGVSEENYGIIDSTEGNSCEITDIKIAKVQFNTKCFELVYGDKSSWYISYIMIINQTGSCPKRKFNKACRNAIQKDLKEVKQRFFDKHSVKGKVKCQETSIWSKWEELVVDHRQPNTFSMIVDRYKELKEIHLDMLKYTSDEMNNLIFENAEMAESFREYHKEKAVLRIVRKECNSSRTNLARIKESSKDLKIN